jgi:amino acid transporter
LNDSLLKKNTAPQENIKLFAAIALGIGGMMGAGLYSLLGLASSHAGSLLPLAFLIGALAASLSVYSYAKLGATFPSSGGAATFTVMSFGPGMMSGGINLFQYIAYLIAAALYAAGFVEYTNSLFGGNLSPLLLKFISVVIVLSCAFLNVLGTSLVGKVESLVIGLVIISLLVFSAMGFQQVDIHHFSAVGSSLEGVVIAAGILYINFQGFGVVANASASMKAPQRELPVSMFSALILVTVIYLAVSIVVVLLMSQQLISSDNGHVLADAARMVAGKMGFIVISISALLACAAAVNATIFAASNIAADLARKKEVSSALGSTVLKSNLRSLTVSSLGVIALVLLFPLSEVGKMASLGFLLVYAAVSYGHLRVCHKTGANPKILWLAIIVNLTLFAALFVNTVHTAPSSAIAMVVALGGSFVIEAFARLRKKAA